METLTPKPSKVLQRVGQRKKKELSKSETVEGKVGWRLQDRQGSAGRLRVEVYLEDHGT